MSTHRTIFATLDTRLAMYNPALPTAYPNVNFTPGTTPWLRVGHLPAPVVRRSIGLDGQNVYTGIYQVTAFCPAGSGPGACESLADSIANHFPIGSVYSGVRIAAVSCAPALSDVDWYSIPVSITYESVTTS